MRKSESHRLSLNLWGLEAPTSGGGGGGSSSSSSASASASASVSFSNHFSPSRQSNGRSLSLSLSLPTTAPKDAAGSFRGDLDENRTLPPEPAAAADANPLYLVVEDPQNMSPPPPPERPLIMLAMRVAVLEKTASNIGALSFLWATVVLLGGYASSMKSDDFWVVTTILVTEGFRIFSRSHELELQHQYTGSSSATVLLITETCHSIGRAFSTLVSPRLRHHHSTGAAAAGNAESPDLERQNATAPITIKHSASGRRRRRHQRSTQLSSPSFWHSLFQAHRISLFFYCLQIMSALVCVALSVWRLVLHGYLTLGERDPEHTHRSALFIFYSLTLTEAAIFLAGRAYWQYHISVRKIFKSTNAHCGLLLHDPEGHTVRRFFYDVYSTCLTDSVFQGLKMSLVNYAMQWLQSDGPEAHREHLLGLKALYAMASPPNLTSTNVIDLNLNQRRQLTLRAISTSSQGAVERLLDMLTWKNEEHRVIRDWAAMLLSKLVENNVAGIRVGAISGSMEAISGLLAPQETHPDDLVDKELPGESAAKISWTQWMDPSSHHIAILPHNPTLHHPNDLRVQLGLRILIKLAYKNEMVCAQIGGTRGLLSRIVSFIDVSNFKSGGEEGYNIVLGLSLQLINDLTACNGLAGRTLRQDIAKVVLSIARLRDILNEKVLQIDNARGTINQTFYSLSRMSDGEYAELLKLKFLAADTLSNLAMDEEVRDVIGRTGGIMHTLFALFFIDLSLGDGCGGGSTTTTTDPPANVSAAPSAITHDATTDGRCKPDIHKLRVRIATVAGKALSLLSLMPRNCARMLRIRPKDIMGERQLTSFHNRLRKSSSINSLTNLSAANDSEVINPSIVDALIYGIGNYKLDPRGQHALFILRNFCEGKNESECSHDCKIRIAQSVTPQVLHNLIVSPIMSSRGNHCL